jgi:hypothetical protein
MKFENSKICFDLSRSLSIGHLKIRDELKWFRDTHDQNFKPRTIRSSGTIEKGVLQESGVIFKFCFKEGCRLLHLLDYIGFFGVTSMTLSSRSSCHLRQARNQIMSQSTTTEQLHLKIRDEFNRLCDTLDNDVKSRIVHSSGPFKKERVLQESGVIYKFCFKEGCRLLHFLDYIRVIGVTSTTLSSCFSCHLRQFRNQTRSQSLTIEQLHLMIRDEFNRLPGTLENNSHCDGETHQHLHRAVARPIRPAIAEALISTDWTLATRLITTGFTEI